jgi:thiamine biosynthesis protein ThiS
MTRTETPSGVISLTVNGQRRVLSEGTTVSGLLETLELHPQTVVVEHNRAIVRDRALYQTIELDDDDVVEIVHFVGGG